MVGNDWLDSELPLDISEFRCAGVGKSRVVIVFEQTKRRYTYALHDGVLDLGTPEIEGDSAPHAPEVIDCLARAVALKAVRDASAGRRSPGQMPSHRTPRALLRGLLHLR